MGSGRRSAEASTPRVTRKPDHVGQQPLLDDVDRAAGGRHHRGDLGHPTGHAHHGAGPVRRAQQARQYGHALGDHDAATVGSYVRVLQIAEVVQTRIGGVGDRDQAVRHGLTLLCMVEVDRMLVVGRLSTANGSLAGSGRSQGSRSRRLDPPRRGCCRRRFAMACSANAAIRCCRSGTGRCANSPRHAQSSSPHSPSSYSTRIRSRSRSLPWVIDSSRFSTSSCSQATASIWS